MRQWHRLIGPAYAKNAELNGYDPVEIPTRAECPGHIAEIDKAIFSMRKCNRGRPVCS
jgi:hypothetical protein